MILPNKVISFNESIFNDVIFILETFKKKLITQVKISNFFIENSNAFESIDNYIFALEILYILDIIDINYNEGVIEYVERT